MAAEGKDEVLRVRVSPAFKRKVERYVKARSKDDENMNQATLLRAAVTEFMKKNPAKAA